MKLKLGNETTLHQKIELILDLIKYESIMVIIGIIEDTEVSFIQTCQGEYGPFYDQDQVGEFITKKIPNEVLTKESSKAVRWLKEKMFPRQVNKKVYDPIIKGQLNLGIS